MPIVHASIGTAQITNDPSAASTAQVDLSMLLSQKYGRLVRQGQSFQITGIQARLVPMDSGYDVGLAVSGSMGFVPATKHSRKAWNEAYQLWRRQKAQAGAVGTHINSDDLEFCWSESTANSRTSVVYAQGLGDSIGANMGLTGASQETSIPNYFSLGDYYDSQHPIAPASKRHWTNTTFKDKKYTDLFPQSEFVYFSSEFSTTHSDNPTATSLYDDALSGAQASTPIMEFPEPVNALCGVLQFTWYCIPDDTGTQNQGDDIARVDLVIYIKSWKPLVFKQRKSRRKTSRRWKGRRSRWTRKGRSRRRR